MTSTMLSPTRAQTTHARPIAGQWCVGLVAIDAATGALAVRSGNAPRFAATRAASCLLEPAVGDSVACLRIAPSEVWILAVLQREEGTPNVLRSPGGLRIDAGDGELTLHGERIAMNAQQLDAVATAMTLSTETADVVGRQLSVVATRLKLVGSLLSSVFDRVQHFSKNYARTTEGIDSVAAAHIECQASQLLRMEGEHTLVNGRSLVKARGAQIHFG